MKKTFMIFLLFVTSCSPLPLKGQPEYEHPVELFEQNEDCPNICWIGIQPNVTTKDEVQKILRSQSFIERNSIRWNSKGVEALWSEENIGPVNAWVDIGIENEIVSYIAISQPYPLTTGDLIELLGPPDKINLSIEFGSNNDTFSWYYLYYTSPRVMIEAWNNNGEVAGPSPNDDVRLFKVDMTDERLLGATQTIYDNAQPWLGYGHLEEYLPAEGTP